MTMVRTCLECDRIRPHLEDDYMCVNCRQGRTVPLPTDPTLTRGDILRLRLLQESVVSIEGSGDMSGITFTFSNGDVVNIVHFSHKDEMGREVRP